MTRVRYFYADNVRNLPKLVPSSYERKRASNLLLLLRLEQFKLDSSRSVSILDELGYVDIPVFHICVPDVFSDFWCLFLSENHYISYRAQIVTNVPFDLIC